MAHASLRTWGVGPSTLDPGEAIDLHRDGPEPLFMVSNREGRRQRIESSPIPTGMFV